MPMKMGIHRKPMGRGDLAFLDSRIRGNDGGMFFQKHLEPGCQCLHLVFLLVASPLLSQEELPVILFGILV